MKQTLIWAIAIAVTLTGCASVPGDGSGSDAGMRWSPRPTCEQQGGFRVADTCEYN